MRDFKQELAALLGEEGTKNGRIKTEEAMSRHTTFRIGGPAQYFVAPKDAKELAACVALCRENGVSWFILGNGSNLLVSDQGWRGAVISTENLKACEVSGTMLRAGAGCLLSQAARRAKDEGLTGFEFAAGIPGTVGGALVMNAGAYGSEIKDVLISATVLDPDGAVHKLPARELGLGYRTSCIPREGYVVLEAEFNLLEGDRENIGKRMEELALLRKSKQPLEYPSAGSTFKRPAGYFAGKLIDDAGLRGFQIGGAQVSEKHCGFVINKDHATAKDVLELCEEVKRRVKAQAGVELEMEIKRLGF